MYYSLGSVYKSRKSRSLEETKSQQENFNEWFTEDKKYLKYKSSFSQLTNFVSSNFDMKETLNQKTISNISEWLPITTSRPSQNQTSILPSSARTEQNEVTPLSNNTNTDQPSNTNNIILKNKIIMYVLLILVAMTFHPYIFVMLILPFLTKETWSKFTWLIIFCVLLSSIFIDEFMNVFLSATENFGQNYSTEMMLAYGVNPLRVVIELIPAVLSYFSRNKINNSKNKVLILGCNMLLLKSLMTFISLFVNPLFAYRVGVYFSSLNAIIVPWMLVNVFSNNKNNRFIVCAYLIFLTAYQLYDTCGFSWPLDRFLHVGITEIFK